MRPAPEPFDPDFSHWADDLRARRRLRRRAETLRRLAIVAWVAAMAVMVFVGLGGR